MRNSPPETTASMATPAASPGEDDDPKAQEYSLVFSQQVARLVVEKHTQLVKDDEKYSTQKVRMSDCLLIFLTVGTTLIDVTGFYFIRR